jgi:hypothetical protein
MRIVMLVGCVVGLFMPVSARADRAKAVPTYNNVGIELWLSAPAPQGAEVDVGIKERGDPGGFREVHPLSRVGKKRFAGSIFHLEPGTHYVVRLSSSAFREDKLVKVMTRPDSFPDACGTVYHVSPKGDDARSGRSPAEAFRTLRKALSVVRAGDEIRLHDGRYYEGGLRMSASGTSSRPIVIRNARGAKPVLDGTDPSWRGEWTVYDAEHNVYWTPTKRQPRNAYLNGKHLFRDRHLKELVSNRWKTPAAFHADGKHLYVRFPKGGGPDTQTVTLPKHSTCLTLEGKHCIQFRGLEFCYYGAGPFHRALYLDGSDENLIDHCTFHHVGIGVAIKRASNFNTIQHCHFYESPVSAWSFKAVKLRVDDFESGAIFVYGSKQVNQGNVIRHNVIEDMMDGVHLFSIGARGPTKHMDFHDNVVRNLLDDGIECDGAGSNVRIYRNRIDDFLTGISLAPAQGGPTYVMRNLLTGWRDSRSHVYEGYPFKFNVNSRLTIDWVHLYHNTCHTDRPGQNGFLFKGYSKWRNLVSRNNIYAGTRYAIENRTRFRMPISFDHDNLYTTARGRFALWSRKRYPSLAAFARATGLERHGLSAPPRFINAASGDYRLASRSPMIDRGVVIPGVNDDYFGDAPDLGAFEYKPSGTALLPR